MYWVIKLLIHSFYHVMNIPWLPIGMVDSEVKVCGPYQTVLVQYVISVIITFHIFHSVLTELMLILFHSVLTGLMLTVSLSPLIVLLTLLLTTWVRKS